MKTDYYNTKESVEEYIKLAEGVNGYELIEKLKAFLPEESSLLEIGSGPGTDWEILKKTFNVIGSDYSSEFLKHLQSRHPDGEFLVLDAITLEVETKFDGIYFNKVFQHLANDDLELSIKRQHDILNEGGIILHSFWKGEGSEVFKGLLVNYQTQETLTHFYQELFDIISIENYKEFEDDDSILLLARKK